MGNVFLGYVSSRWDHVAIRLLWKISTLRISRLIKIIQCGVIVFINYLFYNISLLNSFSNVTYSIPTFNVLLNVQ